MRATERLDAPSGSRRFHAIASRRPAFVSVLLLLAFFGSLCSGAAWAMMTDERGQSFTDSSRSPRTPSLAPVSHTVTWLHVFEWSFDNILTTFAQSVAGGPFIEQGFTLSLPEMDSAVEIRPVAGGPSESLLTDHLMTALAAIGDNGVELRSTSYWSYGGVKAGADPGVIGFAGARRHPRTGSLLLRNRVYSPELMRFLSPDPTGFNGGWNPYAFAVNRPAMWRDPTGEFVPALLVGAAIGAVLNYRQDRSVRGAVIGAAAGVAGVAAFAGAAAYLGGMSALFAKGGAVKLIAASGAAGAAGFGVSGTAKGGLVHGMVTAAVGGVFGVAASLGAALTPALPALGAAISAPVVTAAVTRDPVDTLVSLIPLAAVGAGRCPAPGGATAGPRARHFTSPEAMRQIHTDMALNPSRGTPIGVHVEVEPFGPLRGGAAETGAAGRGAYIEFDLPPGTVPTPGYIGPRKTAVIPAETPLPLTDLNPTFGKTRPWWWPWGPE
jgi:RHS repeat-associated protein